MFFRKGEKLLLVIFVLIMVCAMSGCGLIGKIYENNTIEDMLEKNEDAINDFLVVGESTNIVGGENSNSVVIFDNDISIGNTNGQEYVVDLEDLIYEKVGFEYAVIGGAELYSTPGVNSEIIGNFYDGEGLLIYFQTEADGMLWGKTDGGWVRMVDVACAHYDNPEEDDVPGKDEAANVLSSEECWAEAAIDHDGSNGFGMENMGVGTLEVYGEWYFGEDGNFFFAGSDEVYGFDSVDSDFGYLGSTGRGAQYKEGFYTLDGNILTLNYTYIEWEETLDYPVTQVVTLEFYDDLVVMVDENGNRAYIYCQDYYSIWERNHSGG